MNPSPPPAVNPEPTLDLTPIVLENQQPIVAWDNEQLANVKIIVATVVSLGGLYWDVVCALACAMQESTLRNLPGGDRDSIGLFQQRPSQGWGTPAQLNDPIYATTAFLQGTANTLPGLLGHPERYGVALTVAVQSVQLSGFPDAYAQWQTNAEALAGFYLNGGTDVPASPFPNPPVPYLWEQARYYSSGRPDGLDFIVVHSVEAPLETGVAGNVGDFFNGPGDPGNPTSAHVVVGSDHIVEMVHPMDTAWHCGNGNQRGYGMEQPGYAAYSRAQWTSPDGLKQIDNFGWWAAQIALKYGLQARWLTDSQLATPGVKGFCTHADITRVLGGTTHTDPGPNYPRDLLMAAVKKYMGGAPPVTVTDPLETIMQWYNSKDEYEAMLKALVQDRVHTVLSTDSVVGSAAFGPHFQSGVAKGVAAGIAAVRGDIAAQSTWLHTQLGTVLAAVKSLVSTK